MFSAYSWGDFFKVVILLAIPYYSYVAWKYYREEIRDWFFSKREKDRNSAQPSTVEEEDEADDSDLYSVKTYASDNSAPIEAHPAQPVNTPKVPEATAVADNKDEPVHDPQPVAAAQVTDVDISDGVVVNEQTVETFELGLPSVSSRPAERSLAEVINASRRMKVDDNGEHIPYDQQDAQALELAGTLNQQKGIGNVLAGLSFTR